MNGLVGTTCIGEEEDPVPYEVLKELGVSYTEAFTQTKGMVKVATKLKEVNKDKFCTLPFSITVEAEAFGAQVDIDPCFATPRTRDRTFTKLEQVRDMLSMNFGTGRIKEVLDAIKVLSDNGEDVILNVEGPLTILSMLIDTKTIYKEMIKRPDLLIYVCDMITHFLCEYMREGMKRGATVISYADSFGAYDLVSNEVYTRICGVVTYRLLKQIEKDLNGCIVHLCAKTSVGFEKAGFCEKVKREVNPDITYAEALKEAVKNKEVKFVGLRCMKLCPKRIGIPYYWELKLAKNIY